MPFLPIKFIVLILSLITLVSCDGDSVLGCGGFIKSHVPIDFSKIVVKLLTKQGILKDKTSCAPNTGYYFVPLYDKVSEEEMAPAEDPLPSEYEFNGITVTPPDIPAVQIITTEQARNLFLNTHSWLKQARVFYTLRDYPLHYVNAVLDLSELYRFLAFYEADLDSQYNVQKRRADTLETLTTILREIRPTCYVSVSVELLRELTEVQIELLGINLKRLFMAEGVKENEDSMNRRIAAVSDLHSKLESLGNMMGNSTYDLQSLQPEIQTEMSAETAETTEALGDDTEQGTGELEKEMTVENKETLNENGKMPDGNVDTSLPSTSNSVP